MDSRRNTVLILLAAFAIVIAATALFTHKKPTGSLNIVLNTPDTSTITASLNSKVFKITGLSSNYTLVAGDYTLKINKQGYASFTAKFSIDKNSSVVVNANLQREATSVTPTSQSIDIALPDSTQVTGTTYFYQKTWAVLNVQTSDGNGAVIVAQYNDSTKHWDTVLGPDTIFDSESTGTLPSQIQDYLTQNNYIIDGAQ